MKSCPLWIWLCWGWLANTGPQWDCSGDVLATYNCLISKWQQCEHYCMQIPVQTSGDRWHLCLYRSACTVLFYGWRQPYRLKIKYCNEIDNGKWGQYIHQPAQQCWHNTDCLHTPYVFSPGMAAPLLPEYETRWWVIATRATSFLTVLNSWCMLLCVGSIIHCSVLP